MLDQPLPVPEKRAQRLPYLPMLISFGARGKGPGIEQDVSSQHD
jgi:hypothetical protein